jgi:hypothetical protein
MPPPNLDTLLKQYQYPGMTYVESRIAQAWIEQHGAEYDQINFNVRLGDGITPPDGFAPELQQMATDLTQKRADLVAIAGTIADLVEVKVRISFGVIGQLLGYQHLWERDFPQYQIRKLIAIGRSVVQDADGALARHNINVELFAQVPFNP